MKFVYGFILFVIFILLLIIYFINLVYLSSTNMFLFSKNSYVSLPVWLLVLIFLSMIFGAVAILMFQSFIKWRPKDIFDEDF